MLETVDGTVGQEELNFKQGWPPGDGTNAQIYIVKTPAVLPAELNSKIITNDLTLGMSMFAGSRTKFITPYDDNHGFAKWVYENAYELFKLGPGRHFGEWWGQGINRGYGLKKKGFSLFNTKRWGEDTLRSACCHVVPVIVEGEFSSDLIMTALSWLSDGSLAAPGFIDPEGIVIYHHAGNLLFKKTLKNDEVPKSGKKEN